MEILCEDITREILKRLPVKCLVKFKSVSKSWCSIISSREFANSNFEHSTGRLFCFINFSDGVLVSKCNAVEKLKARRYTDMETWDREVVSSCNGLVCVHKNTGTVILWNPATQKTWKLPFSGDDYESVIYKYGFGYDPISDDYKVVESKYQMGFRYIDEELIMIYSARANSWKCVNWDAGFIMGWGEAGVFVNGCVHWKVNLHGDDHQNWSVIAINLTTEKCEVIGHPNVEGFDDPDLVSIGGSGKSLCLSISFEDCTDIWMMRESGNVDSWTRVVRVENSKCLMGRPNEHFRALERENMLSKLVTRFYEFLNGRPCIRGRDKMFNKLVNGIYEVDSSIEYIMEFNCSMYRESLISPS